MALSDYIFAIIALFYMPVALAMGVFGMVVALVKHPFSYFGTKLRLVAPTCLTEGWNHSYVNLPDRGIKLHYVSCGDQGKPLMLFLHGFPEFWYSWRHQLKEFQSSYRTVAIDMRGYGDSDKPEGIDSYTMPMLVGDVKSVIKELGYNKCVLVAHDWGGAVAWAFTIQCPEMVDRLIINNIPHPAAFIKHVSSDYKQLLKSWYIFFFQWPKLPEIMLRARDFQFFYAAFKCKNINAFSEEDFEAFKYTFSKPGGFTPPVNYYRAIVQRPQPRDPALMKKVQPKTLIIWGTNDMALETQMAPMSIEFCDDARVHYIEGASHWVQQDEPEECNRVMWEFLEE